ncbi:MAG: SdpI family protein [Ardenticatenaceae bacterium]|nr:SdpI family protein [Ardenticatenaceae bacterium]
MNKNLQNNQVVNLNLGPLVWASAAVVLIMTVVSFWAWGQIPEGAQIPVHWNARGEVDRYGSVFEGLFLMPLIMVGITGLLYAIPKIEPRRLNIAQSIKAYKAVWIGLLIFMSILHGALILSVLGYAVNIGFLVPMMMGILFVILGNYMGKIRSNFMFGIRTPWTLSSELSWNKTHRLGGRLFVLVGLLMIVTSFIPASEFWVYVMMSSVFGMVIVLFVYSYLVYRSDPQIQ